MKLFLASPEQSASQLLTSQSVSIALYANAQFAGFALRYLRLSSRYDRTTNSHRELKYNPVQIHAAGTLSMTSSHYQT